MQARLFEGRPRLDDVRLNHLSVRVEGEVDRERTGCGRVFGALGFVAVTELLPVFNDDRGDHLLGACLAGVTF